MEGIVIMEGQILQNWQERLNSLEQNQLGIMKLIQQLMPKTSQSNVPDYISISDASKKYHLSRVTINNKINAYKKLKNREIDRLQSGNFYLINELELQEAIKIKGQYFK